MAWRSGSLSRTLLNAARSPAVNRSATASAFRRPIPTFATSTHRLSFTNPRTLGAFACAQSLLPVHSVVAGLRLTSYVAVDARACCELSQGT